MRIVPQPVGACLGELVVERGDAIGREGAGRGHERGQSAHRRTQRVPLSASSARLPAARRSCDQPGALHPAGPRATQRRGTEAKRRRPSGKACERGGPVDARGGGAGARQQLPAGQLIGREPLAAQPADVVAQADDEEEGDEQEADDRGPLDEAKRNRAAADLLGQRPEDVAAVERQEREEVDDRERERDEREDAERLDRVDWKDWRVAS